MTNPETLVLSYAPPVAAGGKFRYNNIPYEVLSVDYEEPTHDKDDRPVPARYLLKVLAIESMLEPAVAH